MLYVYINKKTKKYYFQITILDPISKISTKHKRCGFATYNDAYKAAMLFTGESKSKELTGLSIQMIIDDFLEFKSHSLQETSIQKLRSIIDIYIRPSIQDKYINSFSKREATVFYNDLLKFDFEPEYFNTIIATLKRIFKYAETYYDVTNNPTKILEYRKSIIKPIDPQEVYTLEEFNKFISVLSNLKDQYELSWLVFFTVLMFTGLRRGEAKALRWSDVDYKLKRIIVDEQVIDKVKNQRFVISNKLKNPQSYRKVPLDNKTLIILQQLMVMRMEDDTFEVGDFIFLRKNTEAKMPFADSTIYNRNKKIQQLAGVKYINIHGFRHSYASLMLSIGVPLTAVSESLGHSSIAITQKVYLHAITNDHIKHFEKLNELDH